VAAGVLPGVVVVPALLLVAALLAESFGRQAWSLWRRDRLGRHGDVAARVVGPVSA
jgi:hypothetical protein